MPHPFDFAQGRLLRFLQRMGGDAAGTTLVRSTPPVVDAFVASSLRLKVGGDAEFLPNSCFL